MKIGHFNLQTWDQLLYLKLNYMDDPSFYLVLSYTHELNIMSRIDTEPWWWQFDFVLCNMIVAVMCEKCHSVRWG
jgi:hypothetical protein